MAPSRAKLVGIIILITSLLGVGVSMPIMALRLKGGGDTLVWFDDPITDEQFTFHDQPVEFVTLDDEDPRVEIHWRGATIAQPLVGQAVDERLPVLLKHEDWLRVFLMAEGASTRASLEASVAAGELTPRLIVAMRLPPEGYNPDSWGKVRRKEWRYRFIELLPPTDGDQPFAEFDGTYGEIDALSDPVYRAQTSRDADQWMYHAMLQVTPATLYRSKNKPIETAMRTMGWTWSVAALSMIGIVLGAGMIAASRVQPTEAPR